MATTHAAGATGPQESLTSSVNASAHCKGVFPTLLAQVDSLDLRELAERCVSSVPHCSEEASESLPPPCESDPPWHRRAQLQRLDRHGSPAPDFAAALRGQPAGHEELQLAVFQRGSARAHFLAWELRCPVVAYQVSQAVALRVRLSRTLRGRVSCLSGNLRVSVTWFAVAAQQHVLHLRAVQPH